LVSEDAEVSPVSICIEFGLKHLSNNVIIAIEILAHIAMIPMVYIQCSF